MSGRFALVIGNTEYHDPGLSQLTAPGRDAEEFARILQDPLLCGFEDVRTLLNEPEHAVRGAIEDLFDQKKPDDLLVLYFSGHGVRDEMGALYLAVTNTNRARLRSTAIKSSFISEAMDQSRSKRQVLILDCCNSGAFSQGTKAATGVSIGTASAFQSGYGRVILTASDSTQYAWEGNQVIGETDNSLFTHFLIEGLQGQADMNGDGCITVDELYDYAYEKVSLATPKQTPSKFSTKQQGEIIFRQNIHIQDTRPIPLPDDLIDAMQSSLPFVREGAVRQLAELLKGKNLALARSAREALQRITEEDDSRQVSRLASQVLISFQQANEAAQKKAEEERLAKLMIEEELAARAKVEKERKAKEQAERLAAQKAEDERLARLKAEEELAARAKAEKERKEKEEADLLAAQKEEEERLARLKAEEELAARTKAEKERKEKEEADRLAAQKAEEERLARLKAEEELAAQAKAEKERKEKEEADRLAAQKAEEERLAKLRIEEALAAAATAEKERKEKEEADRLAAQKAQEDRLVIQEGEELAGGEEEITPVLAIQEEAQTSTSPVASLMKKPPSRGLMVGVTAVVVLILAGIGVRAFYNPSTPIATETLVIQSSPVPHTQVPAKVPETKISTLLPAGTPTSTSPIPVTGPVMAVGSTYFYSDGTVLAAVPAGEFTMGAEGGDHPRHQVTLADYWIYSTEVTNQQFALCVSQGKCTAPDAEDNPGYSEYQMANRPVTGVTYEQAGKYCKFTNGRLPTEAEWEKAAQSARGGSYPWGSAAPSCELLNFDHCLDGLANVVDYQKGVSQYGALNMAGNAFEWTADWYDANYYASSPARDPKGPASGTSRSVRSSSYTSTADESAVAVRNSEDPLNHRPDLGFRCVVDDPVYFAPLCELPVVYDAQAAQSMEPQESCPDLQIKPAPYCNGKVPLVNVTFVGPEKSTIDAPNCTPSNNPALYTCRINGTIVSISAACQLNDISDQACISGYKVQDNACVPDGKTGSSARNCLAGSYDSKLGCCNVPTTQKEVAPGLKLCPVGAFYAAKANMCLPQPVQEITTISYKVALLNCTVTGGGGGGGGGGTSPTATGGCQATAAQIQSCNDQAPFYAWNSKTCSCEPQ